MLDLFLTTAWAVVIIVAVVFLDVTLFMGTYDEKAIYWASSTRHGRSLPDLIASVETDPGWFNVYVQSNKRLNYIDGAKACLVTIEHVRSMLNSPEARLKYVTSLGEMRLQ